MEAQAMVEDLSQRVEPVAPQSGKPAAPRQAVTGVMPPQLGEARIREAFPSLLDSAPGLANLAARLIRSVVLAPLGWLLLAPLFVKRLLPFVCKRYTLTNR